VLPVPDEELSLRPLLRDEVLFVSADARQTRRPMDLQRLSERPLVLYDAHYGAEDPTRRQLQERFQQGALSLEPVLEVERVEGALRCVTADAADSLAASSVLRIAGSTVPAVGFDPPLYDTVAVVTRTDAPLSPASRAFVAIAERRLAALVASSPSIRAVG